MTKIMSGMALLLFSVWFTGNALGQIKGVTEGDKIRITAPGFMDELITGTVIDISPDTIHVLKEYSEFWTEIPLNSIEQLEIRRIVRKTGRGALIGAGIGGFSLGILTMASNEPCEPDEWCFIEFTDGQAFLMGAAGGLLLGGAAGAIIGTFIKDKKWKNVPLKITTEPVSLNYLKQSANPGITLKWLF